MKRALALGLIALPLATARADAPLQRVVTTAQLTRPMWTPLARLGDQIDLPGVDPYVRMQLAIRDVAHGVTDMLSWFEEHADCVIPDLTVLTTAPVAKSESSGFGWRDDPIRHIRKFHSGADLRGNFGTPVLAAGDGVVTFTGEQNGYGNIVYIDHGGGVVTRYAHLQRIHAKLNTVITAGTKLGEVGATGRATGPHLHFEVRLDGRPVDPVTAMTVAELARENPAAGALAAYALTPALQQDAASAIDPPKQKAPPKPIAKPDEPRPERPGRMPHAKPTS